MSPNRSRGVGMTSTRTRERLLRRLREKGIENEEVLERMADVPRHLFVDEALASRAYEDTALPIGFGQTISQPYVVGLMTQTLVEQLGPRQRTSKVLEIGTGCGYQTAVLAPLVQHVYSLERINPLVLKARQTLRELGINNVSVRHADGFQGWRSEAPYHGILVAAAPESVPQALLEQLDEGGHLIMPVGQLSRQELVCITREGERFRKRKMIGVSFVPLLGGTTR